MVGVRKDEDIVCASRKLEGVLMHQHGLAIRELTIDINSGTGSSYLGELLVTTNLTAAYIYSLSPEGRDNDMMKGFRVRVYPTKTNEPQFINHAGACRFIWNHMLDVQQERYKNGESYLSAFGMINLLKPLKNDCEHSWLYEVSNTSLQRICQDLNDAYQRFFKKISSKPRYKSRKDSKMSFPICCEKFYFVDDKYVQIQKIGRVRYKTDLDIPIGRNHKFYDVRVSYEDGKWFISFAMECESQTPELTDKSMGIDLGIKELAVVAIDGETEPIVFHNINKSRKVRQLEKKQKRLQRNISRKYEKNKVGNRYVKTKNIEREESKLRKVYRKLSNIRNNYKHPTTRTLVSMLPCRIIMEDLNITGLMKNKYLAKAIQEQCLSEFIRQMKYKCEWNGIEFIQVDRFYPSSKTCSCCGAIKKDLKLSDRTYVCHNCGTVIDRDFNAAINLSKYVA